MKTAYALTNYDLVLDEKTAEAVRPYILKIKDMPADDKPRERLEKYGPAALSIAELMAVVLMSGTKKGGCYDNGVANYPRLWRAHSIQSEES